MLDANDWFYDEEPLSYKLELLEPDPSRGPTAEDVIIWPSGNEFSNESMFQISAETKGVIPFRFTAKDPFDLEAEADGYAYFVDAVIEFDPFQSEGTEQSLDLMEMFGYAYETFVVSSNIEAWSTDIFAEQNGYYIENNVLIVNRKSQLPFGTIPGLLKITYVANEETYELLIIVKINEMPPLA